MGNKEQNWLDIEISDETKQLLDETEGLIKEAENLIYEMTGERLKHYEFSPDEQYPVVIDKNLDVVMVPQVPIEEIYYKSGGLYQATLEGQMGYLDGTGRMAIPFKYESAYPFSESGLALVITPEGEASYINKDGGQVIALNEGIVDGGIFEQGLSFITDGETYTFINEKGEEAFSEKFLYTDGFAKNGVAIVKGMNGIFKGIDTKGNTLFELPEGISALGFHKNSEVTIIENKGKLGLMDKEGNITVECRYKEIEVSRFSDFHIVKAGKNWAIINKFGEEVMEPAFKSITVINKQGYFAAKIDEKSEPASKIQGFSKSDLYVGRITVSGNTINTSISYAIPGVKSVEISEDDPLLTLTYKVGAKVLHDITKRENDNGIISGFFSAFYGGEAVVELPGTILASIILSKSENE